MAWVVLSTTSLLDDNTSARPASEAVQLAKLESLVRKSGYKPVTLKNIMRNSSTITSATAPDNVSRYRTDFAGDILKSISAGSCSTVTGTRPTCYLYRQSAVGNYSLIGDCV